MEGFQLKWRPWKELGTSEYVVLMAAKAEQETGQGENDKYLVKLQLRKPVDLALPIHWNLRVMHLQQEDSRQKLCTVSALNLEAGSMVEHYKTFFQNFVKQCEQAGMSTLTMEEPHLPNQGWSTAPLVPPERKCDLTTEHIQPYYHMRLADAANQLDVSQSMLRKRIRQLGLPRWPYRQVQALSKSSAK